MAKQSPKGRKKETTPKTYTYKNRTSLYWKSGAQEAVKQYCSDKGIKKVNDFIQQAICEKLRREGYLKKK